MIVSQILEHVSSYRNCCLSARDPVPLQSLPSEKRVEILNELMLQHSGNTCQIVGTLPFPGDGKDEAASTAYVRELNILSSSLPPAIFVCNGEDIAFISTCI